MKKTKTKGTGPGRRLVGDGLKLGLAVLFALALLPLAGWAQPGAPGAPPACRDGRGTISGKVTGVDGQAAAGVDVHATTGNGYIHHSGTTDADGRYVLTKVCAGEFQVIALKGDNIAPEAGFYDEDQDGQPDLVEISDSALTADDIDMVLKAVQGRSPGQPGQPVPPAPAPQPAPRGQNGPGTISGKVTDVDGHPAAGVQVLGFTENGSASAQTTTGADGAYKLANVCIGRYQVVALRLDRTNPGQGFYDADGDGMPDIVEIKAGALVAAGIDITLRPSGRSPLRPLGWTGQPVPLQPGVPGQPVPPRSGGGCPEPDGDVSGTVSDTSGDPVAGAKVVLLDTNDRQLDVQTDSQGGYHFAHVRGGTYFAVAIAVKGGGALLMGLYDPDHDGRPDEIDISDGHWAATDIDITLAPANGRKLADVTWRTVKVIQGHGGARRPVELWMRLLQLARPAPQPGHRPDVPSQPDRFPAFQE